MAALNKEGESLSGPPAGYFVVVQRDGAAASDDLDIGHLVESLWRGRWFVVAGVIAGLLVAAAHAFLTQPVYRAEAIVAVRSENAQGPLGMLGGQLGGLASLAGLNLGNAGDSREEFLAVLRSRTLARQFIEQRQLLPVLFAKDWNEEAKQFRGRAPTIDDAVDFFVKDVRKIRVDAKTRLVTLTFEWRDPQLAADWTNKYIDLGNQILRSRAMARARQSVDYLNDELARTTQEPIRQSIFRLLEGRINEIMFANVEPEFAFQVIDRAVPADPEKFVRPKRLLELVAGFLVGAVIGGLIALWRTRRMDGPG